MARRNARVKKLIKKTKVTVERAPKEEENFFQRLSSSLVKDSSTLFPNKQSYLSLILGVFIVAVLAILVYNYFNRPTGELGPSQQQINGESIESKDVDKDSLPGKYTVKEGDTLFIIAQRYYDDGFLYPEIIKVNKLENENLIAVGQVLEIPKVEKPKTQSSPTPSYELNATKSDVATGGAENQTIWGEKITSDSYKVESGDWLSKIAGRAYGDIYQYEKIAKANNIPNPDLIEPGTVLKIPR